MRRAQRRPSKSSAAINGRPVVDPLTGCPGFGVLGMQSPPCASNSEALQLLRFAKHSRESSMRTNAADPTVGLDSAEVDERVRPATPPENAVTVDAGHP